MKLDLSGHHVEITDGLREAANNKFSNIKSHYPDLTNLSLILTVERHEHKVEANTSYKGAPIAVHASNDDMYAALASASSKLSAALAHRKGSASAGRHKKPEYQVEAGAAE
ncbi:ribosome-associated translation inhibitor RaiA [bacterium SCSIO 12696]|nr:ribosome-associated translation inhibitor RaiA [bacterium SCSIO 12696]